MLLCGSSMGGKGHPAVQRQHMNAKIPKNWSAPFSYLNNVASKYQCYSKRPAVLQVPTSSLRRNINIGKR